MLEDLLETLRAVPDIDLELRCEPSPDHPVFERLAVRYRATCLPQGPGDLGERLARAVGAAFVRGHRRVLVVGSDSPTLPSHLIAEALRRLEATDVVLGPAFDGGYYLLGLNRLEPALFRDVPWSGPEVLAVTAERARAAGLEVSLLPFWYDVDEPADLARLVSHARAVRAADRGSDGGRSGPGAEGPECTSSLPGHRTVALLERFLSGSGR
jgi:hypothetical protein